MALKTAIAKLLETLPPTFTEWAPGANRSVLETFSS